MNKDILKQYAREHPTRNVAVVGLRDGEGNVLLMRSHKLPELWQPVGGGIDQEDVSPSAAAAREVREELGLFLNARDLKQVLTTPYDFGEGTVYFFETSVDRTNLELHIDPEEVRECAWFSLDKLESLPAMPATRKYLQYLLN